MVEPHKKALQKCRAFLVQNMAFQDDILWDALQTEGVVSNIQVENIKARSPSNSRQVSAFLDHMLRRPRPDYDKMKAALRQYDQGHCADMLESEEGPGGTQAQPVRQPIVAQSQQPVSTARAAARDAQAEEINEAATNLSGLKMTGVHTPASPASIYQLETELDEIKGSPLSKELKLSTQVQYNRIYDEEMCYPIKSKHRGRGLVITMTGDREGWQEDVKSVAKMFRYLGVRTEFHFDLKEKELTQELEKFASDDRKNEVVDCLFVILMGHGGIWNGMEFLRTADSVAFGPLRKRLEKIFDNTVYPQLIDKPKVFLMQMCRGDAPDTGIVMKNKFGETQKDAMDTRRQRVVAKFTDYIIGYASQPGTTAHRNTQKGAWYIQELAKVVMAHAHSRQFSSMLMDVNKNLETVAAKGGPDAQFAQVSESINGLKSPLFLFPGLDPNAP